MTRSRMSHPEDRVIADPSTPEGLYRLFAVEPHGWSTVLLEDQLRSIFLASSATGNLIQVSREEAERMLAERIYRLWQGDRRWAPLESLPLVASAFARDASQTDIETAEGAF